MIKSFIDSFMDKKLDIEKFFKDKHPEGYQDIVTNVVRFLKTDGNENISPDRVHEINDGDSHGILVYIIGADGYQPEDYWYVKIGYGSSSACDTLESISHGSYEKPTKEQIDDYMMLSLHIVQGLRKIDTDVV